jgi:hypothetical protein
MISYLLATIPWTFGCIALSPPNPTAIKYRKYVSGTFYGSIIPLIYFFIQHKVHRVPGGMFRLDRQAGEEKRGQVGGDGWLEDRGRDGRAGKPKQSKHLS